MVTLRSYRVEDQETVVTLWWGSWHSIRAGLRHPHSLADWRRRWAEEIATRQQIVVAEDNSTVVGFAATDLSNRVLDQIFVEPSRKRQGIGCQLLFWAQRLMPDGFRLYTLAENVASQHCGPSLRLRRTLIGVASGSTGIFVPNRAPLATRDIFPRPAGPAESLKLNMPSRVASPSLKA